MKATYCLLNPQGQIAFRKEHDPETDVWNIDAGWSLRLASECAGLPDAPTPPPRNAHQVQPEGFWISKARDAQNDYANLTTMYQNLSGLGALPPESPVQFGALDGVKTVTWLRYQQIMAAYGMALAAEIFGGTTSDQ